MTPFLQLGRQGGAAEDDGGLDLSDRDRAILVTLASLRLMTGRQLQRVFFAGDITSSTNPRVARRALQRLTDAGCVQRLDRRVGGLRAGSSSYVYALTQKGGRGIAEEIGRGRKREPGLTFVAHTLAISEACVRLHEAQRAGQLASLRLQTEPQAWRRLQGPEGGQLKPDLFVVAAVGEVEHLAFVEIDNGTEHGPALLRKAEIYERHYRSGQEQASLGAYPYVLWLANRPARVERIARVLASSRRLTQALHKVGLQTDVVSVLIQPNQEGGDNA